MASPNVETISDEERKEMINLLHGAVARHTGYRNGLYDLWRGLIDKLSGQKIVTVEKATVI